MNRSSTAMSIWFGTVKALIKRDMIRFFRQRSRVFGALAQPLIFWAVIGSGLDSSFRLDADSAIGYREYFYPGVVLMVVLFTSIFSTITLIEDRQSGFIQAIEVGPAGGGAVVFGKTFGTTMLALAQAILFLLLAPLAGFSYASIDWFQLFATLILSSAAMSSLGVAVAWIINSSVGYHAVMSAVLIPMWILSGSMFPAKSAVMKWVIFFNPMSYCAEGVRRALYGGNLGKTFGSPGVDWWVDLAVLALFTVASLSASIAVSRKQI